MSTTLWGLPVVELEALERRRLAAGQMGADPPEPAEPAEVHGEVATICVHGPLAAHADLWDRLFGVGSYEDVARQLTDALDDPRVARIVLDVDSPGGTIAGARALVLAVREATKPIVAHVTGQACSAAYWIASQADRIVAGPTAVIGALGVLACTHEVEGERRYVSSSTPAKTTDAEAGRSALQQLVDDQAAVLLRDVAVGRGLDPDAEDLAAALGGGAAVAGGRALALGLIDDLQDESRSVGWGSDMDSTAQTEAHVAQDSITIAATELAELRAQAARGVALEAQAAESVELRARVAELAVKAQAAEALQATVAELQRQGQVREREDVLRRHVERGAIATGDLEAIRADYDAAPEVMRRQLDRLAAGAAVPLGTTGRTATDHERAHAGVAQSAADVHALVTAQMAAHKQDYSTALEAVLQSQPALRAVAFGVA